MKKVSQSKQEHAFLANKAYHMRVNSVLMTTKVGSGHFTSSLSCADLVSALFFSGMRFDPQDPQNPDNDRFILSKGHASPILYAVWRELGVISKQELQAYRTFESVLGGHPAPKFDRVEVATGSLGIGLSAGLGMCLAARLDKRSYHTWVLMGDGELAEGSVWEAAQLAAHYKAANLTAIVDVNAWGQAGKTLYAHHMDRLKAMWKAFGWQVITVDGHDIPAVCRAYRTARAHQGEPTVILARTIKGKGVTLVQDKPGWHGKSLSVDQEQTALKQLARIYHKDIPTPTYTWHPHLPKHHERKLPATQPLALPSYTLGERRATRYAYGQALAALGTADARVVSLDGEVKNSTFAQLFEEKHPARFFECFIAEQNMVSMAVGLSRRGKKVFCSTFACFFTRAFDQLRMAAIGEANIALVGSHAGVSIGADGPSQMGLEDIAMIRALPGSVVLHPCDAVSTWKLVGAMNNYTGISYLRTLRPQTPVIYPNEEVFEIGGCKVLRFYEDADACVVTAGYPVFEALKAHDALLKKNIRISVIDLYSIKPLDAQTVIAVGRTAHGRIITVEDHYPTGGLGEAVTSVLCNEGFQITSLSVKNLPHSGTPEELYAYEGINAAAIERAVRG